MQSVKQIWKCHYKVQIIDCLNGGPWGQDRAMHNRDAKFDIGLYLEIFLKLQVQSLLNKHGSINVQCMQMLVPGSRWGHTRGPNFNIINILNNPLKNSQCTVQQINMEISIYIDKCRFKILQMVTLGVKIGTKICDKVEVRNCF